MFGVDFVYCRKNVKKKKGKGKEKKPYTPFPPPQQPSKVRIVMVVEFFWAFLKCKCVRLIGVLSSLKLHT